MNELNSERCRKNRDGVLEVVTQELFVCDCGEPRTNQIKCFNSGLRIQKTTSGERAALTTH
jgi:hypothetical protein